jgi:c-di-GMP-binding flagellar brake protein YcgR
MVILGKHHANGAAPTQRVRACRPQSDMTRSCSLIDKRSHARFPMNLEVTIVVAGERYRAESRDVSLGGMFVYTDVKVPFGANVGVMLKLPALKEEISVEAVARWHQDGGVGLSFKSMRAREVWALNQLFKTAV